MQTFTEYLKLKNEELVTEGVLDSLKNIFDSIITAAMRMLSINNLSDRVLGELKHFKNELPSLIRGYNIKKINYIDKEEMDGKIVIKIEYINYENNLCFLDITLEYNGDNFLVIVDNYGGVKKTTKTFNKSIDALKYITTIN